MKIKRLYCWPVAGLVVTAFSLVGLSSCVTAGIEKPAYTVERKDGAVEIRDYPALKLATTQMGAEGRRGNDGAFMKLFRYIEGANAGGQKIAMTSPVVMEGAGDERTMGFIVPAKVAAVGAIPEPARADVRIGEIAAGRFAVLRFRGSGKPEQETEASRRLSAWLAAEGLGAAGDPIFAYYDPPWTPVPFRRNEVMVRLTAASPEKP
jgi:hypothetical protein